MVNHTNVSSWREAHATVQLQSEDYWGITVGALVDALLKCRRDLEIQGVRLAADGRHLTIRAKVGEG